MNLFDWFRKHKTHNVPSSTQESVLKLAQMEEEMGKIHSYLRERGIVYELEKDEIPFTVFWPTRSADARSLRELGAQLRRWTESHSAVKRILGLEQLLDGECPEVSVLLLMIPFFPTKPESCVERVGLVVVDRGANIEGLAKSFYDLLEGSGIGQAMSWEQYSYMNR